MQDSLQAVRNSLRQEYATPNPDRRNLTTHEAQTVHLVQEWVDPAERLYWEDRARKILAIDLMREEIQRLQEQIAAIEAELFP